MKKSDTLKNQEDKRPEGEEETRDHSLQAQAKRRAEHPEHLNAGTAFDWEDLDAYQQELDRLDKEGPGRSKGTD